MPFIESFTSFFQTRNGDNSGPVQNYVQGLIQCGQGERNMERMREKVPDFNYENTQYSLSEAPWEHRPLMDAVARRADNLLRNYPRIRAIIDDTGIGKKGAQSVGVAWQHNGRLGKVHNSQIAVCTALSGDNQATLIDIRLYLPEEWARSQARCAKVGVPETQRHFRTKSQLALESLRHQRKLGVRFDVVCMDSGYGSDTSFLYALDTDGLIFVSEVHCDQTIWIEHPWHHNQGRREGSILKKERPSQPATRVDTWASQQPDTDWQRLRTRDSDHGWVEVNYLAQRVWTHHEGQEKLMWLLVWEDPEERCQRQSATSPAAPRRHYALSNAPADTDPRQLIADGQHRVLIECALRDAKSQAGMADYQVRGWRAWHHHMALVMLAMLFFLSEKMHHPAPGVSVSITAGDIVFALERLLPTRDTSRAETEKMLAERLKARQRDQDRRKQKTARSRPPLAPDEILCSRT